MSQLRWKKCRYQSPISDVIVVDGRACVVGADAEGYIPLTFTRGQTIDIVAPSLSPAGS